LEDSPGLGLAEQRRHRATRSDREQRRQRAVSGLGPPEPRSPELWPATISRPASSAPNGTAWTRIVPRVDRPKLARRRLPSLPCWAQRGNWLRADDAQLIRCSPREAHAVKPHPGTGESARPRPHRHSPPAPPAGLPARSARSRIDGEREIAFNALSSETLPDGVSSHTLGAAWTDQLSQKIPYMNKGTGHDHSLPSALASIRFSDGTSIASNSTVSWRAGPVTPHCTIDVFVHHRNFGMFD